MAIDRQLRDLIETYDLTSISVGLIRVGDRWLTNVSVQGGGQCETGGEYGEAITQALSKCIADLSAKRTPALAVPHLEAVA